MHSLATIDYIIVIIYLSGMVGVGVWFARRHTNFEDFFLAGRSLISIVKLLCSETKVDLRICPSIATTLTVA